ncbi:putative RepB family plasmid replication initiator protein [Gammaproteobacteria bacterium]
MLCSVCTANITIHMVRKMKKEMGAVVVKHNRLIEGKYDLTIQEKRIVLWLISQVREKEINYLTINIKDFSSFLGISGNDIQNQFMRVIESLMERVVKIFNEEKNEVEHVHWVDYAKYNLGENTATFRISEELIPYLVDLHRNFTKFSLKTALNLKSAYAIRVYELLKQYQKIGERTITIQELRDYCGIKEEQYLLYSNLKANVLERAKLEINNKTDLRIDYIEVKKNRKVSAIKFIIKVIIDITSPYNEIEKSINPIDNDTERLELFDKMRSYGVIEATANELLNNYEFIIIRASIENITLRIRNGEVINNTGGYLVYLIRNYYKNMSSSEIAEKSVAEKRQEAEARLEAAAKASIAAFHEMVNDHQRKQ